VALQFIAYDGTAFKDGEEGEALSGRFIITFSHLKFEHPEATFELPLHRLTLELTAAGALVFGDDESGWRVECAEDRVFKDAFLLRNPQLGRQAQDLQARQQGGRTLKSALMFLLIFAAIFPVGWLVAKVAAEAVIHSIPVSMEEHLTEKAIQEAPDIFVIVTNNPHQAMAEALVRRIAAALPPTARRYQFHVSIIDNREANAFAMPGGRIFIYTGLFDRIRTPDELAGVLAHEMAHVTQRHGLRQIVVAGGPFFALRLFISDQQGLLSAISSGSQMLIGCQFSRGVERQADAIGWHYLYAANIDPRGLADFLRHDDNAEVAMAIPKILSDHPADNQRIAWLDEFWEKSARKTGFVDLQAELGKP
jgi:Zn-dependent protease with chaperone function